MGRICPQNIILINDLGRNFYSLFFLAFIYIKTLWFWVLFLIFFADFLLKRQFFRNKKFLDFANIFSPSSLNRMSTDNDFDKTTFIPKYFQVKLTTVFFDDWMQIEVEKLRQTLKFKAAIRFSHLSFRNALNPFFYTERQLNIPNFERKPA